MKDTELQLAMAREIPDILEIYKDDCGGEYIVWEDDGNIPTDREWLEVMRLAENTLTDDQYRQFHYNLLKSRNKECEPCCRCHSSTWQEHARAFLKVKGKWVES